MEMLMKNVNLAGLNTNIVTAALNTQILKIV